MLRQLCALLAEAHGQLISNITWVVAVLQHCHGWCMCASMPLLRLLVRHFVGLPDVMPRYVQNVLH